MVHTVSTTIRDKELVIETGLLAKQASGSVTVKYGDTVILSTVCLSKKAVDGDYLPLTVNYNEKYYAAGKIPGGFIKREGRPKDKEILTSRLIDRPMRPLFPKNFRHDIQLIPTTISADQINPPDVIAMVAASACVSISEAPFNGPIGAVRVGLINDEFIVNPTFQELEESLLDIVVAGTKDAVTMIEGGCSEISEQKMIEAIEFASEFIKKTIEIQEELVGLVNPEKFPVPEEISNPDLEARIKEMAHDKLTSAIFGNKEKLKREKAVDSIFKEIEETLKSEEAADEVIAQAYEIFEDLEYKIVRKKILDENIRADGRNPDEIRPIDIKVSLLPRAHGAALFTRGETQALAITTLGTLTDEQRFDDIEGESTSNFLLHYNFPPYSVGETGRVGSPGRREIGHGKLAERSIQYVLPERNKFPYTIRIVSEIMESNGSSSMATVCATSLALMDAGAPIKEHVSGIAMGLIIDKETDKHVILTDIMGLEDHLGDMDFKVAGTKNGITGFQLDLKVEGITSDIMAQALEKAKIARMSILDKMNQAIPEHRESLSEFAPKIIVVSIHPDKIKDVIGPGGKIIKNITEESGAQINIDAFGEVSIASKDEASCKKAYDIIMDIVSDLEVGRTYDGFVKKVIESGAIIDVGSGKEGFLHISKLASHRVRAVYDYLSEGDKISVKVIDVDKFSGKVSFVPATQLSPKPDAGNRSPRRGPPRSSHGRNYRGR